LRNFDFSNTEQGVTGGQINVYTYFTQNLYFARREYRLNRLNPARQFDCSPVQYPRRWTRPFSYRNGVCSVKRRLLNCSNHLWPEQFYFIVELATLRQGAW